MNVYRMHRKVAAAALACSMIVWLTASPALAAWKGDTISNFGDSDSEVTGLAASPKGRVFVAWVTRGSDELHFGKKTSSGWTDTTVAGASTFTQCYSTDADMGPSLAFNSKGLPAIAHACIAVGGGAPVKYTKGVNGVWKTKRIGYGPSGPCDSSATDVDLIFNPSNDRPVIVITDVCTQDITGFFLGNSGWSRVQLVPGSGGAFRYGKVSLAVDPSSGKLALAFISDRYGRGSMSFREFSWKGAEVGGSFSSFALPSGDVPWGEPSLAFETDGTPHIAFQEGTAYGTPVLDAYSFLAMVSRVAGVWGSPITVDSSVAMTGIEPELSLGDGMFHIAYGDATNGDLRLASSADGSAWTLETIASTGNVGHFPSLLVSVGGKVRIAHYDETKTRLLSLFGP